MNARKIILAGGSGFLGRALVPDLLSRGYEVVVLTRSPSPGGNVRQLKWDGKNVGDWHTELDGAEAIVNFTGKSVNCRYTPENRRELIASRVDSVKVLGEAVARCANPPRVWVQAGSLAIYGDAGDRICDESTLAGEGFATEICLAWEQAFNELALPNTRRVLLRIGFVLRQGEGALGTLQRLTRWFLGGAVGNGRQYISWLHWADMNHIILAAIGRPDLIGVFNATGPSPVTNAQFMKNLRHALHRPYSPPAPAWIVKIGARLMGTEAELALTGRRCVPKRLTETGFEFQHPQLVETLDDLYR